MRLRLRVRTTAREIPWGSLHDPSRGVAYTLLRTSPELASRLHQDGWGAHRMRPMGVGVPLFPSAPHRPGVYAAGGVGLVEFGSPLVAVVQAWAEALAGMKTLSWGGTPLHIDGVELVEPPDFSNGTAVMRTRSIVVLKGTRLKATEVQAAKPTAGEARQSAWVYAGEPQFGSFFAQNLRRKAETMSLAPDVEVQAISWIGPQRSFPVKGGKKYGKAIEVQLRGAPDVLRCLWSWGLGESTSAGFGWVSA